MLANAPFQLIKDALTHRNHGHGEDMHRIYRPLREQAHSYRNGVCCATAQRLDDDGIPTIHAPRKTASRQIPCRSNRRLRRSRRRLTPRTSKTPHKSVGAGLLANASSQLISMSRTHRNREQAHSHRNGVCCATAQRLDDEGIPTIHAPRKTASRQIPCRSNRRLRRSRRRLTPRTSKTHT